MDDVYLVNKWNSLSSSTVLQIPPTTELYSVLSQNTKKHKKHNFFLPSFTSGDGSAEPRWCATSAPKRLRHLTSDRRPRAPCWHGRQLQPAHGSHQGPGGSDQRSLHVGFALPAQLPVLLPPLLQLTGLHC